MFNFKVKYISVYVNGVFYEEADDYTFDNRTGIFMFANKFNADEKVTITVAYIDNASGNLDNTYENVYERVKYYDYFSNVTDLNFDIDKFNSFVLDFTKNDSSPINPISIHLPDTRASTGKSIMVTLMFGAQVPVITWSTNIVWNTDDTTSPTFEASKSTVISLTKDNVNTKYAANIVVKSIRTKDLLFPKIKPPINGEILASWNGDTGMWFDDVESEEWIYIGLVSGMARIFTEAMLHFNRDLQTFLSNNTNDFIMLFYSGIDNWFDNLSYYDSLYINAYGYILMERFLNNNYISDSDALNMVTTNGPLTDYYSTDVENLTILYSPLLNYIAKEAAESYNISDFVNMRFHGSLTDTQLSTYLNDEYNGVSIQDAAFGYVFNNQDIGYQILQEEMDELNLLLNFDLFVSFFPDGVGTGLYVNQYGTDLGMWGGYLTNIRSNLFAESYWDRSIVYEDTHGTALYTPSAYNNMSNVHSSGEFVIFDFGNQVTKIPQYVLVSTFDLTKNGLLFTDANIEVNSSNTRRCSANKYLSHWASTVGDCTVDCYEFTNTTVRDSLMTYFGENAGEGYGNDGEWLPVQVVLH